MVFPFLTVFLIFLLWLALRYAKIARIREEDMESFWERERRANSTRAKDITSLDYLTIPLDKFPLNFSDEEDVKAIENELLELSTHRLLNLTGMNNSDIKSAFGTPNFETMCQIGEDFDRVLVLLNDYAAKLMEADRFSDAITVLTFAVEAGTDVTDSYIRLVDCYGKEGLEGKTEFIKMLVQNSNLLTKNKILEHIERQPNEQQ